MSDEKKEPFTTGQSKEVPLTPPLTEANVQPVVEVDGGITRSDTDHMTTDSGRFVEN